MNRINWLYFLRDEKSKETVFLYGLSLPTKSQTVKNYDPKQIGVIGKKQINMLQSVTDKDFQLQDFRIDFRYIHPLAKHNSEVLAKKSVTQVSVDVNRDNPESLLQSPVNTDVYYTSDLEKYNDAAYLKSENIEELAEILKILSEETGQSFKSAYSKRLGCFEYSTPQSWSEDYPTPFTVHIEPKGNKPHQYFFERKKDFSNEENTIHLIVYNSDHEILFDQLKTIKAAEEKIVFDPVINGNDSSYEYWIFNKDGILIDRNKCVFLRAISMGMNMLGNQYDIDENIFSKNSPLKKKKNTVGIISHSSRIEVDLDKDCADKKIFKKMDLLYQRINNYFLNASSKENGKWFRKDNDAEELAKYLNEITSSGSYKITIVDPYFSDGGTDYLLLLKNSNLSLHIISDSTKVKEENIRNATSVLSSAKDYAIPLSRSKWYNLKNVKMHDRFICIEDTTSNKSEDVKVYMLSNSLNNLLKDCDFCIAPLKGEIKRMALEHIFSLQAKCSEGNIVYPKKTSQEVKNVN